MTSMTGLGRLLGTKRRRHEASGRIAERGRSWLVKAKVSGIQGHIVRKL